jgi:Txe/YoeB family toxin of Txe-Axe toxin-antitoxin module
MGKSSLMVRTAKKLREQGVSVVVLDLTAIGQNLTPEQWYDGLVVRMSGQLWLEDELETFWRDTSRISPLQRFFSAVREVVLVQSPGPLVIFVDELDVVRSLPFSTDEFFAAIRECYTRRAEDPEFNRLTFCLLGVATPTDLIQDTRITPFNIGKRIELNDFTAEETASLAEGLRDSEAGGQYPEQFLQRIFYWTHGHPYLTQRLCQAIAAIKTNPRFTIGKHQPLDGLCDELFFSNRARERDDNLIFVRERILRSDVDQAALLDLYIQVRSGKRVMDDETNWLVSILRLSGILRVSKGVLQVRNRIYERVFDRGWVEAHMPGGELRRQKAAYRRGIVRTASVALVVLLAVLAAGLINSNRGAAASWRPIEQ